ncbi:unnamed protein product [Cuscuta campestris]|uniref:DUF4219 domain-containing protein n=1 Tax=Cuscuta campestris TaxID=132261 RepID=A0A484KIM9_9ASTE|nr:unnamed protein product [Cuscuta campestris]
MRIFIQSVDYTLWMAINNGVSLPTKKVGTKRVKKLEEEYNEEDIKKVEQDAKALNLLLCAIDAQEIQKFSGYQTAKNLWDGIREKYKTLQGEKEVTHICVMANEEEETSVFSVGCQTMVLANHPNMHVGNPNSDVGLPKPWADDSSEYVWALGPLQVDFLEALRGAPLVALTNLISWDFEVFLVSVYPMQVLQLLCKTILFILSDTDNKRTVGFFIITMILSFFITPVTTHVHCHLLPQCWEMQSACRVYAIYCLLPCRVYAISSIPISASRVMVLILGLGGKKSYNDPPLEKINDNSSSVLVTAGTKRSNASRMFNAGVTEGQSTTMPPLFDGTNYSYWKERMRIFIQFNDYKLWLIVKNGCGILMKEVDGVYLPKTKEEFDENDFKKMELNAMAINIIYCGVNVDDYRKISQCETAMQMWEKLEVTFEGTTQVREAKIDQLTHEYELFSMKENEKVEEMFERFSNIINPLNLLGKVYTDRELVRKVLRSLSPKWRSKVDAIEEGRDFQTMT